MGNGVSTSVYGTPPWVARRLAVIFPEVAGGPVPVGEVLLQVAALVPGGEAITLLGSLAGRVMSSQEQLQVVALWQPQLAWITGAEQAAGLAFAGPTPDRRDKAAVLDDEFVATNLVPVLNCTLDHAQERVWRARQLREQFTDLGDLLRCELKSCGHVPMADDPQAVVALIVGAAAVRTLREPPVRTQ